MRKSNEHSKDSNTDTLVRLKRRLRKYGSRLLKTYGAEAVGIGYKHVDGKRTDQIAVIFFVKKKLNRDELRRAGMKQVPQKLFGYPTDVRETGEFHKF